MRKSSSFLSEVVPHSFCGDHAHDSVLSSLHQFARANPIYFARDDQLIHGMSCSVYEADINRYWLDSKKHDSCYQPFYPTWLLSAYALAREARSLGFQELVDIGSGDGRIAYCGALMGMKSFGLEIDAGLVLLQKQVALHTGVKFQALESDATRFDYGELGLTQPLFFLSGLPEHGEMLANYVIEKVLSQPGLADRAGFNFMGTHVMKSMTRDHTGWGWGDTLSRYHLKPFGTLTLPTYWTTDETIDTPYIFATSA